MDQTSEFTMNKTSELTSTEATTNYSTIVVHLIEDKPTPMIIFFWMFCGFLILVELLLLVGYTCSHFWNSQKRRTKNHAFTIKVDV